MKYIGTVSFTTVANDDVLVKVKQKEHIIHPTFKLDNPSTKLIISRISFETSGACTFLVNGADELIVNGNHSTSEDFRAQQLIAKTPGIAVTMTYEYGDSYIIEPKQTTGGGSSGDVDLTPYAKKADLAVQLTTQTLNATTIKKGGVAVATTSDLTNYYTKTETYNKTEVDDLIANPVGTSLNYETGKISKDFTIGARGPVGPPNFNNLYVEGSIYTGPKAEMPTITGPGAAGGNIYMPEGKAFCGLTAEGPITANPDLGIAGDSGVRTIAFIGKVTDEDKINNESSVYVGTNVSRLYLYSATAYPTIVSKKEVLVVDETGPVRKIKVGEPREMVNTNSPVATQEWINGLLLSTGLIGGQQDTTSYVSAPSDANVAFSIVASEAFTNVSMGWVLGADGYVSHNKSNAKTAWVPMLQAGHTWNDLYFKVSEADSTDISFSLARTENYIYGIQFGQKNYQLFSIDRAGKRYFNYQTAISNNLDFTGTCRMKHDETNNTFVFSCIDATNTEMKLVDIPMTSFAGFQEYELAEHYQGILVNASTTRSNMLQVVDRPAGFDPVAKYGESINPYAVVRQQEKKQLEEEITVLKDAVFTPQVMSRVAQDQRLLKYIDDLVARRVEEVLSRR